MFQMKYFMCFLWRYKRKYDRWLLSRKVICEPLPRRKTKAKCYIYHSITYLLRRLDWCATLPDTVHCRLWASAFLQMFSPHIHHSIHAAYYEQEMVEYKRILFCSHLFLSWSDAVNARLITLNRANKVLKIMEWNEIDCNMCGNHE